MTKALTNYDKIKISTAHVFLQYNQATMIHKYSLDYNSDWLYITFKLNLFPFLPIIIRFWEADDEFPASLQILADRNTLDYMHYETLMFALTHLFSRLNEEMRNEKR